MEGKSSVCCVHFCGGHKYRSNNIPASVQLSFISTLRNECSTEAHPKAKIAPEFQELNAEEYRKLQCECQKEIEHLLKRIRKLKECIEVEKFKVSKFMASDPDIRFYTGLPDYQTFFKTKTRLLAEL